MGCLVDTIVSSPSSQHRCAICRTNFGDVSGGFMVTGRLDTGGIGEIDLGPMIDEVEREAYYRAHPGARRADMFQQYMFNMDFDEAEKMLKGEDTLGNGIPLSPDVTHERDKWTALQMAASNDDIEGVEFLLRYGADPLLEDESGCSLSSTQLSLHFSIPIKRERTPLLHSR